MRKLSLFFRQTGRYTPDLLINRRRWEFCQFFRDIVPADCACNYRQSGKQEKDSNLYRQVIKFSIPMV